MFLVFYIWIYYEIHKNLCVEAIFSNFLLIKAVKLHG